MELCRAHLPLANWHSLSATTHKVSISLVTTDPTAPSHQRSKSVRAAWWMALPLLGIVVHFVFLLSLRTGWINAFFDDSMHRFGPGGDFFSIYAAGVRARQGMSVYLQGGHVAAIPYGYPFRYAPLVA